MKRRAFSLIEAVTSVLMLAIAVPPMLGFVRIAGAERADAVTVARAVALGTLVLESALADASSPHGPLSYDAFENPMTYLYDPASGLAARLAALTEPYTRAGLSWTLDVGQPVGPSGVLEADPARNVFRVLTVRVSCPSARGDRFEMPLSVMVGDL